MLCSWLSILKTPKQLVDRTPLFVQRLYWTDRFIGRPKLLARHSFPELKACQVCFVMACPGFVKIKDRRQVPLPLPILKEYVVLMKIFVAEACMADVQEKMPLSI